MGTLSHIIKMIKTLAFLFLAATVLAEPEPAPTAAADPKADPYLLYGGYGYGLGHYGGYYGGLGHYGGLGYYGHGLYGRKRRSAEPEPNAVADPTADPNADPYLLYGGYGYGLGHGYASYGYGYPYSYGHYWGRKRRSAEPEPEPTADPKADPYLLYGGYGSYYGHGLGYSGYYGYPYVYGK